MRLINLPSVINKVRCTQINRNFASKSIAVEVKPQEVFEAEVLSGTPIEILKRKVRIYKPSETTMQSGQSGSSWKIDWDVKDRWSNSVMGWCSSADPMQAVNIKFHTKEQAILFAERQGFAWEVQEPKLAKWTKKTYADNYTFVPGHLRLHKTK